MPKTIFVSGGSRGIGRAIVTCAAKAGWNVAFSYVTRRDMAESLMVKLANDVPDIAVKAYALDVCDADAVDAVADAVLTDFDGVQAVVPSAGISINGLASSLSNANWNTVINTNLTGAFHVCRAFLMEMVAQRDGRIVLISSISATGASGQAAYAASKAGLEGLGKALAKEYGPKGIRTNIVIPGYFDTDMTRETMSTQLSEYAIQYCPLRRLGELDELANTVLFLISEGGGYINGESIRVTGGLDWAP